MTTYKLKTGGRCRPQLAKMSIDPRYVSNSHLTTLLEQLYEIMTREDARRLSPATIILMTVVCRSTPPPSQCLPPFLSRRGFIYHSHPLVVVSAHRLLCGVLLDYGSGMRRLSSCSTPRFSFVADVRGGTHVMHGS